MAEQDGDIGLINYGGRPRKYDSPEEFDIKVDEYYRHCRATGEPITWTGLALYLGFSSRQSIDEYLNYDGFSDSVKRAKTLVEYGYEKLLHRGSNAAAPIFALKNFGWNDKQEGDTDDDEAPSLNIQFSVKEPAGEIKVTNAKSDT